MAYSMLGYNRTITCTNINVLLNIGPGARGGRKKKRLKSNLPNTFDHCRFLRRHHRATVLFLENWWGNGERSGVVVFSPFLVLRLLTVSIIVT